MEKTINFAGYKCQALYSKGEGGAPDELVLTDRPLQISFLLWGMAVLVIFYLM